jgi:hypothetical protein
MWQKISLLFFFLLSHLSSFSQNQAEKTKILVLGTPHLFEIENFKNEMLDGVVEKLKSFNFEVVCVEKMPGRLLYDINSRNDSAFDGLTRMRKHIKLADSVQAVMGTTFLESEDRISRLISKSELTSEDRKKLFYDYIATTNIPSAAVQYRYLSNQQGLFTSEFDLYLKEYIAKELASSNEYFSLAVPLAYEEEINKIEAIDNFQDVFLLTKYYPSFEQDFKNHPEIIDTVMSSLVFVKAEQLKQKAIANQDLSELYAFLNSGEYMKEDYETQWQVWLKTGFSTNSDRARFSLWEMRNLQICANILEVVARNPEKNILVIIGSAHKSFLEKYLKQIEDIEVLTY